MKKRLITPYALKHKLENKNKLIKKENKKLPTKSKG